MEYSFYELTEQLTDEQAIPSFFPQAEQLATIFSKLRSQWVDFWSRVQFFCSHSPYIDISWDLVWTPFPFCLYS